jgi:quercetin dioxygenase-like cupin family protein
MGPGDLISIPTRIFRGFENVGEDLGFLWAVLGKDDPGRVLWAPYVFDMAKDYGLVLLENGTLIDTAKGETVPAGAGVMPKTTQAQVESLIKVDSAGLERCVLRAGSARPQGLFHGVAGLSERLLVGGGPITWEHGFTVCETTLASGAAVPQHSLDVPDVWFVQHGEVEVLMGEQTARCAAGDTITICRGSIRSLRNCGAGDAIIVQARGGDRLPAIAGH